MARESCISENSHYILKLRDFSNGRRGLLPAQAEVPSKSEENEREVHVIDWTVRPPICCLCRC